TGLAEAQGQEQKPDGGQVKALGMVRARRLHAAEIPEAEAELDVEQARQLLEVIPPEAESLEPAALAWLDTVPIAQPAAIPADLSARLPGALASMGRADAFEDVHVVAHREGQPPLRREAHNLAATD